MRTVKVIENAEKLKRTKDGDERFRRYLRTEMEDDISAQSGMQTRWKEYIRMYRGIPETQFTKDPIPIRMMEVTLGAIAADTLHASAYDMIFTASPLVVARGAPEYEDHAKGFQQLANHIAVDEFVGLQEAAQDGMLDCVQLGTGTYYVIWSEAYRVTGISEIVDRGPKIYAIPPEDLVVPGSARPSIDDSRLVAYRVVLNEGELELRGKSNGWDWERAQPTEGVVPVRRYRDAAAATHETSKGTVRQYELYDIYLYFDYSGKGREQDLYCVWDRKSNEILYLAYNPFDRRPFIVSRYQHQPHEFYGIGIMEMIAPYQREITDWHNFRMANARLVNSRAWGVKIGSPLAGERLRIVPNKPLYFQSPDDLKDFRMADVYPSALQYEQASIQLAERRVGTMTDFSARPMPGHRTPGMTMLTIMQQINKRFAPAFQAMRNGLSQSVVQAIVRMQEQLKRGGDNAAFIERNITKLLGNEMGQKVLNVMRDSSTEIADRITIEMTASSISSNRDADRQNSMMVLQALAGYYDKTIQLAVKVAKASSEAMDRLLRSFDQIRDPRIFLITEDDFTALVQQMPQQGLAGMAQQMGQTPMEAQGGSTQMAPAPAGEPGGD